jgi:hypothetical protein
MPSTRKNFMWPLLSIAAIALGCLLATGIVIYHNSQNNFHMPPCEAMRPYIEYHGTTYFATLDGSVLASSDLGNAITMIGDGSDQATSCMPAGITVYSVKGYPPTSRLAADFQRLMLFEPYSPTPTPSPAVSPVRQ